MEVALRPPRNRGIGDSFSYGPVSADVASSPNPSPLCPRNPQGVTQQMVGNTCQPVFNAADYDDPSAEIWRWCMRDPSRCQLIDHNVPVSAQPYQTPQPVTQAMIDANKQAQAIFQANQAAIAAAATKPTSGTTTAGNVFGSTGIPTWMILGGALLAAYLLMGKR